MADTNPRGVWYVDRASSHPGCALYSTSNKKDEDGNSVYGRLVCSGDGKLIIADKHLTRDPCILARISFEYYVEHSISGLSSSVYGGLSIRYGVGGKVWVRSAYSAITSTPLNSDGSVYLRSFDISGVEAWFNRRLEVHECTLTVYAQHLDAANKYLKEHPGTDLFVSFAYASSSSYVDSNARELAVWFASDSTSDWESTAVQPDFNKELADESSPGVSVSLKGM